MAEDVLEETFVLALVSPLSSPCLPGAWGRIPFPPIFALHGYNSSPWIGLFRGSLDLQSSGVLLGNWPGALRWPFPPHSWPQLWGGGGGKRGGRCPPPRAREALSRPLHVEALRAPWSQNLPCNPLVLCDEAFLTFPGRRIPDSQDNGFFCLFVFLMMNQIWFFWLGRLWKWSSGTVCFSVCCPH